MKRSQLIDAVVATQAALTALAAQPTCIPTPVTDSERGVLLDSERARLEVLA